VAATEPFKVTARGSNSIHRFFACPGEILKKLPYDCPPIVMLLRQHWDMFSRGLAAMSSLDFELDNQISHLESEWRQAYQAGDDARAELKALAAGPTLKAIMIEQARERLNRTEALKARIMAKIERLEDSFLGRDS